MIRFVISLLSLLLTTLSAGANELHIGLASTDITGPKGYRMSGYFSERLNTGTHDPLLAKAIVFKQGDVKAALVVCDLIGLGTSISAEARKLASEKTGIPVEHIVIAATHSHTGPLYGGELREYFHARAVLKHGKDPHEEIDYPKELKAKLVEAIVAADKAAVPAHLAAGFAQQEGLSFNRRFHMQDGTVVFNPGKLNPNIIKTAGPIDPQVGLLLVRNAKNEPIGSLTVFALHLDTVGGTDYSADYPHHLANILRGQYGDSFMSLFGAGTCGDINHIDVSHNKPQKGQPEAKRIGESLAQTVAKELMNLPRIEKPSLTVKRAIVQAPLQAYSAEQVEWAAKQMDKIGTSKLPFLAQVEACKILSVEQYRKGGDTVPLEVQVIRLGEDVAMVTLPGEVFVDLGLIIKRESPFKTTIVIELCNDSPGYIPTQKAFAEGSYETVNSRVKTGGGEMMAEAAVKMLKELK